MDRHEQIQRLLSYFLDGARSAGDAGVVHEDIDTAEGADRRVDGCGGAGEGRYVGCVIDGRAPQGPDLLHDADSDRPVAVLAFYRAAEIVDDHQGALSGQGQRMGPTDAPSGASDERDAALEQARPSRHGHSPSRVTPSKVPDLLGQMASDVASPVPFLTYNMKRPWPLRAFLAGRSAFL